MQNKQYPYKQLSDCIRILSADAIEKAKSGHPGVALGMADVMTILVLHFLRFNPNDPKWLNRDRLVLSNGHGSMLLYSMFYLTGYRNFTLGDLKNFRQLHSKTPGHPEYGVYEAIEATTGPLGQGLANAVGMAIAAKKYQDKCGSAVADYKIYCTVGDGCLMEGISYEAASIAGHLKLNNLIILFDDNHISIDGNTNITISEDQLQKFKALGWNVESIDGHDFEQITNALQNAQTSDKPYFIACKTIIGKGCKYKAGSESSHGAPLGLEEITYLKQHLNFKDEAFCIPDELLIIWRNSWLKDKEFYDNWQTAYDILSATDKEYFSPDANLKIKIEYEKLSNVSNIQPESTRGSSGKIIQYLTSSTKKIIFGSADLSLSNNVKNKESTVINQLDFSGNFIHYGVREHAMAAIMNGLALSGFVPVGGTFFVFSDYMRPAIRLSALMNLHVIYIMTHDSIAVGEDGPTHQPVEHLAAMRAMPNLLVLRPADFIETIECWNIALQHKGPSMLVLTRQNVRQVRPIASVANLSNQGAYIMPEQNITNDIDITIFASGSEVAVAIDTAQILNNHNIHTMVISVPCFELFFMQNAEYIQAILSKSELKVAIEAGCSFGWHKIIGPDGMFFGIEDFGASAPMTQIHKHFNLNANYIAEQLLNYCTKNKNNYSP